jgi:predicted RNA-binding protein with PIN domain
VFLIDGYNLMHAVGSAPPPNGTRTQFDSARTRFLDWLAGTPAAKAGTAPLRVVFDAPNSTRDFGTSTHRGLIVTYSFRQTADDLIESLISVEPHPGRVRVVSNDGRLKEYARRHGCRSLTCGQFVDWLLQLDAVESATAPPADEKPTDMTDGELERLLKVFEKRK